MASKLDNFKGKVHTFTREDSVKGGKARSAKKALAARLNAMKNGKYAKGIKSCDNCRINFPCPYRTEEPHQRCELFSPKMIYSVMKSRGLESTEKFDSFISGFAKDYFATCSKDPKVAQASFSSFFEKLLDIKEAMRE